MGRDCCKCFMCVIFLVGGFGLGCGVISHEIRDVVDGETPWSSKVNMRFKTWLMPWSFLSHSKKENTHVSMFFLRGGVMFCCFFLKFDSRFHVSCTNNKTASNHQPTTTNQQPPTTNHQPPTNNNNPSQRSKQSFSPSILRWQFTSSTMDCQWVVAGSMWL